MKSVTTREAGETVQITRRRVPLARLVPEPAGPNNAAGMDWSDHAERVVHPRKPVNTDEVLNDLRGEI